MHPDDGGIREKTQNAVQKIANKLSIELRQDQLDSAADYLRELIRWNRAYNLVGRRLSFDDLLTLFIDSVTPLAVRGLFGEGKEVVDIGSGAGMPGIPLYLIGGPFPLTLVESQRKKITFLRHVCRRLGLDEVSVYPGRLETMQKEENYANDFDVGLARAVMDPTKLCRLARPLISEEGRLVIFVGKTDAERIRKESNRLEGKGWRLENLRSTQRLVGRENYLAVLKKTVPKIEETTRSVISREKEKDRH